MLWKTGPWYTDTVVEMVVFKLQVVVELKYACSLNVKHSNESDTLTNMCISTALKRPVINYKWLKQDHGPHAWYSFSLICEQE